MCGYFGNLHECPAVVDLLNQLRIPLPYPVSQNYQRRPVTGLITAVPGGGYSMSTAVWWYAMKMDAGQWVPNEKVTSFNARNLQSPLWKEAIAQRRGVVFASEVGESNGRDRYLMRSTEGLALGAVYRDWVAPSGAAVRSMAIITRPPHARFSRYHDKSIPCFLPLDVDVLKCWLDPALPTSDAIERMLETPRLYSDLNVTRVKTYQRGEALAAAELLSKDC